jgi:DNA-binding response OmpR family regulator
MEDIEDIEQLADEIKVKILVVDDEPNIRLALTRALNFEGYFVTKAASGGEALELLQEYCYDLMLLDMRMPGMDGIEVMPQARKVCPNLLIIVLTGHPTMDNAIAAVKSHAVDYLLKPVNTHEIVKTVNRVVKKHAQQLRQHRVMRMMGEVVNVYRRIEEDSQPSELDEGRFVRAHPLLLDCARRAVMLEDDWSQVAFLTMHETKLLSSMMSNANEVLSCSRLAYDVWGEKVEEDDAQNTVRPHISRLRQKILDVFKRFELIQTVRGRGYIFVELQE